MVAFAIAVLNRAEGAAEADQRVLALGKRVGGDGKGGGEGREEEEGAE